MVLQVVTHFLQDKMFLKTPIAASATDTENNWSSQQTQMVYWTECIC